MADVDFDANTTTLWEFDPFARMFAELATIDGRIIELAGGTDLLVAEVISEDTPDGPIRTVLSSADGYTWTTVELPGAPTGLCTDGKRVVAVWMTPTAESDTIGLTEVISGGVRPVGEPLELERYRVADGWRDSGRCGMNDLGVLSVHVGYEAAIGNLSPLTRFVPWTHELYDSSNRVSNATPIASGQALILDAAWTGADWVAVGSGHDAEGSVDAMLWRSDDGVTWSLGQTIAGGPGNQEAWSVIVEDGQLLIGGVDVQKATMWVLPA